MGILVDVVKTLPHGLRYALSLLAFLPSLLLTRVLCRLFPSRYRLWDPISPGGSLLVGSAPILPSDARRLRGEGVTHIVNACWEWGGAPALYAELGIRFLHVPTLDFEAPAWKDALRAADFIRDAVRGGGRVLCHCKAGKGRSVCLALAYLVLHEGLKPRAADAMMRAARPHISRKWSLPLIQAVESLSLANAATPRGGGAAGGGASPPGGGGGGGGGGDALFAPLPEERDGERERLALRGLASAGEAV